jgi:hypothetical protein
MRVLTEPAADDLVGDRHKGRDAEMALAIDVVVGSCEHHALLQTASRRGVAVMQIPMGGQLRAQNFVVSAVDLRRNEAKE